MTDPRPAPEETDDALAAELSLRVLSDAEEARARARAAADPDFARRVEGWDERFGRFADEIQPVAPPISAWARVDAATTPAANDDEIRVRFWRRWAVGATGLLAASLVAVAVLAVRPEPPASAPSVAAPLTRVATLTLEDGAVAMTLVYDPATGELYLAPTDKMEGDARVPHLWLLMPEGGVQLVGAIDGAATSRHTLSGALSAMAGQAAQVAVSMEQPGHTPSADAPDGPVVATGSLQRL
ncbi:MAG: anti-sigma factor [Caulobacteraceae bacterium]|nr:anti-sigma factor [Caulobacteraceae bacterium]